jgi:hypothetical protein
MLRYAAFFCCLLPIPALAACESLTSLAIPNRSSTRSSSPSVKRRATPAENLFCSYLALLGLSYRFQQGVYVPHHRIADFLSTIFESRHRD